MVPLTPSGKRLWLLLTLVTFVVSATYAQTLPNTGRCAVSSVPTQVRAEGLTERTGDIILQCSGSIPGAVLTGNLIVYVPVSITNRVNTSNQALDAILSVDYGSGFVPVAVPGVVSNLNITFNGVTVTVPPSGSYTLRISGIRAAVNQLGVFAPRALVASLSFFLPLDQSQLVVATPFVGLYTTMYDAGITCAGSALPSSISLSNLFAAHTALASTRFTEGYGNAFQVRGPTDDTGTRFLVKFSGFPSTAQLYVPDFVAGSGTVVPTLGGDLGGVPQVGQYKPGSGTLLLARVPGADATGAGGQPVFAPTGTATVTLNSASAAALSGGSGYVVYEVVDANPFAIESAQFPTFIGLPSLTAPATAQETVSFAPVSTLGAASQTAPVPRFSAIPPGSDCSIVGDCGANYFPKLSVSSESVIQLAAYANGGPMTSQPGYVPIRNVGGGNLNWAVNINYVNGSGWLTVEPASGQNNGSARIWANTANLAAGTYRANVIVDGGPLAGVTTIPLTLTVSALPATPTPNPTPVTPAVSTVKVDSVVNAASFAATPMVPGSLGTLLGSNLSGKLVSVTFDAIPATLLYVGDKQINLQVPAGLDASKTSATVVATVDGSSSTPQQVSLARAWPAIFPGGLLNEDNSVNGAGKAAKRGDVLQIFVTGVPADASVSVQIGAQSGLVPIYAGAAPDVPGVQQVNVTVPDGVASGAAPLVICATSGGQHTCSTAFTLAVQ